LLGRSACVVTVSAARYVTATFVPFDLAPDVFGFRMQTGVPFGSTRVSDAITPGGYNAPADIWVSNGEYSIGCSGGFTSIPGTIPTVKACA